MWAGLESIGRLFLLSVLILCTPKRAESQIDFTLQLDARFETGFGFLGAIRPLPDGRVLLADPLGEVVAAVDFDSQRADTLGGPGGGPEEYRSPDAVFPLPGDSTLLVDMGNGRLVVIAPDGEFTRTLPIVQQNDRGQLVLSIPRFVDQDGNLYFQPEEVSGGPLPDSASIVRVNLTSRSVDTLGKVKLPDPATRSGTSGVTLGRMPFGPQDDWAVSPSGAVAIVRSEDYRVEWIRPGSPPIFGPSTPYDRVSIQQQEKEAWAEEFFTASISMNIRRGTDGSRAVILTRGTPGGGTLELDQYEWPSSLPPFRSGRSLVSDDGDLWIERYGRVGSPVTIDVFGGSGHKKGELEIPEGRRIAGFGAGVLYLVHKDAFGLHWLERYRLTME